MRHALLGSLLLALTSVALSACSSAADGESAGPQETVTVTVEPEPEPLTLTWGSVGTTVACYDDPTPADIAWFDVQWQANVDLEQFSFELTGARGVTQVGTGQTVPPRNFGGHIALGGEATWDEHRKFLAKDRFLEGTSLDSVDFRSPVAGETGLVVLHLRFDPKVLGTPKGGGFDGVKAEYTTIDGDEGETRIDSQHVIRAGDC